MEAASVPVIERRVHLPADQATPAAARRFVGSALTEVGLVELMAEAALLTTELVTNAVVHAGTDVEVDLVADRDGVTITVTDTAPERPVVPRSEPSAATPRGRGLLILSRVATQWGTTYDAGRKAVWFQLNRSGHPGDPATSSAARAFAELLAVVPVVEAPDDAPGFARALLGALADHVPLRAAAARVDRGDGAGWQTLAQLDPGPQSDPPMRFPLSVGRPWSGHVELSTADAVLPRTLGMLVAERLSSYLEGQRIRESDQSHQAWLAYLADVDTMLGHSLDRALTAALIPRLVAPRLAPWCALHLIGKTGALTLAAATHVDETQLQQLASVMTSERTLDLLSRRSAATGASPVNLDDRIEGHAIRLTARDQSVGVLTAGRNPGRHTTDNPSTLEEIARRASLALDNARIHEERQQIADVLQRSLLPPPLPSIRGVDLAAEYAPTDEKIDVGGDFYDSMPLTDGRWLLLIGDVSGKGVEAAVVTGLVREVVRALVADGRPLPHVLSILNRTLAARGGGLYCTLVLAILEQRLDGELHVVLYLAGHDRPVLMGPRQPAAFVGAAGTVLGLLDHTHSAPTDIRLTAGDALILYTDGVTERRNGRELFGHTRLGHTLQELIGYPASVVAAQLKATVLAFSPTPPQDDIAILVIRNDPQGTADPQL
jgi:sigma-B regulation protein RsbU (phosphoserine phosphatase)